MQLGSILQEERAVTITVAELELVVLATCSSRDISGKILPFYYNEWRG
jgi:hypothetical protein